MSDLISDVQEWIKGTLEAGDLFKGQPRVPVHSARDGNLIDLVEKEVNSATGLSCMVVAPRLSRRVRLQPATLQCVVRVFEDTVVNGSGVSGTEVLLHAWALLDGGQAEDKIWGPMNCQEIVLVKVEGNQMTWDLNMTTEIVLTTKE